MIVLKSEELIKHTHKKTVAALGSFDAIHKGHLAIISEAIRCAKESDLLSVVQLFEVPPAVIDGAGAINTLEKRLRIVETLGADIIVIEKFDDAFKKIEAADFVNEYLKHRYNCKAVVAGDNYQFGHLKKGNAKALFKMCKNCGIEAKILKCQELDGIISSTRIRECIKSGDVEMASALMTRPYGISGEVASGNALGRSIGFPTANIKAPQSQILPKDGVYLSRVRIFGKEFSGLTNVGPKPTVGCAERNIETYIKGFCQDIYGETIEVEFLKRIRDIKKFEDLSQLKLQLEEDLKMLP